MLWVNRIPKGCEKAEDHGSVADLHDGVADLPLEEFTRVIKSLDRDEVANVVRYIGKKIGKNR